MRISTKGRYATRASIYLARHYDMGNITLGEISEKQKISVKYLENIMRSLVAQKIVRSEKGKGGGFVLARHPKDITLKEIILATEGSIATVHCVDDPESCKNVDKCCMHEIWSALTKQTSDFMESYTLCDLSKRCEENNVFMTMYER